MEGWLCARSKWDGRGVGGWILGGIIGSGASGEAQDLKLEAESQAFLERAAQAEAEIPRTRAALDRTPERRRAVLDGTLAQVKGEIAGNYRAVDRFVVFGDPATEPDHVVVWAVVKRPRCGRAGSVRPGPAAPSASVAASSRRPVRNLCEPRSPQPATRRAGATERSGTSPRSTVRCHGRPTTT